jgi:hypothetical protein
LVAAATEFHSRRLWTRCGNDECFAVAVPEEEHPMFASIMGQAGEEFGIMLFRGAEARENLLSMLDSHPAEVEMPDTTAFMGFSMSRLAETPPFARSLLRKARAPCRRECVVPFFVAKDPGRRARGLKRDEVQKCLYVLKGILRAHEDGMLRPTPLRDDAAVLTLTIRGDPLDPTVSSDLQRYESAAPSNIVPLPDVPRDLADLPRLQERWLIGFPSVPIHIQEDDRSVRLVMIVDEATELMLSAELVQGGAPDALEVLYKTLRGQGPLEKKGLPGEILIAQRELFAVLRPVLDALGIACFHEPGMPLLEEITAGFLERLDPYDHEIASGEEEEWDSVPAADDLGGWKACDRQLVDRAMSMLSRTAHAPAKAVARYFGDADRGKAFLNDPDDPFPGCCFFEWMWTDYRPGKRSKTLAERMLGKSLSEPERILLRSRMEAVPSIYKVQAIERGASLTLLDVLFGGETVVHDGGLSESADVNLSFPARLFPAGDFHFVSPLGPPLPMLIVDEAIAFLQERRLELTPDGTRAKPHLFGHLWAWLEEWRREKATAPRMTNTDGEPLCFHTATYRVADETAAREALARRKDVEPKEDGDGYDWLRDNHGDVVPGEKLHLGTLSFVADALLVEVNSAERLAKARQWLDATPGITFQAVRTRSLKEMLETGVPLDDRRTPGDEIPMTPELLDQVEAMLKDHYMKWLDTSIPALDGKTPRQMCRSAKGRERVARMIRTMPTSRGPGGIDIDVPRAEMFKALGLGPV